MHLPSPAWKRIRRSDVSLVNKKQFLSPAWVTAGLVVLELESGVISYLGRESFPCFTLYCLPDTFSKSSNCPSEPSGILLLSAPLLHPLPGTWSPFSCPALLVNPGSFPCFPDFSAPGTSPVSTWVVLNHPSNLNTVVISPAPFEVCPN